MSVPKKLEVRGAVTLGPIQPTSAPFPSGESVLSLNLDQSPQGDAVKTLSINSPAAFVDLMACTGIASVRFIYLRPRAGTITVRLTTAAGVDQVFDLSGLFVLSNPTAGSEVTALAVQGTADLELMITGDP